MMQIPQKSFVATAPNSASSSPTHNSIMEDVILMQEDQLNVTNENKQMYFGSFSSSSGKNLLYLVPSSTSHDDDNDTVSTTITSTTINETMRREFDNHILDVNSDDDNPHSPYTIQNRILIATERWNNVSPISPDKFLAKLLSSRGYDTTLISSQALRSAVGPPADKQILDYDQEILNAVRTSNLEKIQQLFNTGRRLVIF